MNIPNSSKNDKTVFGLGVWTKLLLKYIITGRFFGQNISKCLTFLESPYAFLESPYAFLESPYAFLEGKWKKIKFTHRNRNIQ